MDIMISNFTTENQIGVNCTYTIEDLEIIVKKHGIFTFIITRIFKKPFFDKKMYYLRIMM